MYHIFFYCNILGIISPHPSATPGGPKNKKLTSKHKSGIHSTTGQPGLEGKKVRKTAQPTPLSQPQTADVEWALFSIPPSYARD